MPDIPVPAGEEQIAYSGRIVEVVNQPMKIGAKQMTFEFARRTPGVRLLIVDASNKKLLLTKEYRNELKDYDYRLPGGKVFDSLEEYNQFIASGKDIIVPATKRAIIEAKEETGLVISDPHHFYTSVNGTTMVWDLLYFEVTEWQQDTQELEHGEDITTEWVSFAQAENYALEHMSEDRSVAVLLRWLGKN